MIFVIKLMTSSTFYYSALMSRYFGNIGLSKWCFNIINIYIINVDHLQENILCRFVNTNSITDVLNYCILYATYHIYIQTLFD